nr:VWA domain-containing protein [uncultured Capnocytophaga sp.]
MINSKSEILDKFVRFGKIADKSVRTQIAECLKNWQVVPIEKSFIERKYQDSLNKIIADETVNTLLEKHPHLRDEIFEKAIALLEKIATETEKIELPSHKELIEKVKKNNFSELPKDLIAKHRKLFESIVKVEESAKIEQYKFLKEEFQNKWDSSINSNKFRIRDRKKNIESAKEEDELFERVKKLSIKDFLKEWKVNTFTNFLKNTYSKKDFDLTYYNKKIKEIENQEVEIDQTTQNILKEQLIKEIEQEAEIEKALEEIKVIDKLRKDFLQTLYEEIEKLKELLELLAPFVEDTTALGRLWDLSKGNWKQINFNLLRKYGELLTQKKELLALAEALGRYQKAEIEYKEEAYTNWKIIQQFKYNHSGKSELIGITESDDLNHLLPTELSLFSDIETENIFYKKFSEKKLQSYQFISRESYKQTEAFEGKRQKEVEKDKGPFILAIDTSGSMHGQPEEIAKLIAFAIVKIAYREKRKALLISFSTSYQLFELTDFQNSLPKLVNFLQMSFSGGTDVSEAIKETVRRMEEQDYKNADLLVITDGIFGNMSAQLISQIQMLKQKGNKFNTLIIGASQNTNALSFFDNIWLCDYYLENINNLVKQINSLLK